MKQLAIALIITLTPALAGCGRFPTGEGTYNGRVVDVSWRGYLFKSCEVGLQLGEQSSKLSRGSSLDKALCTKLQKRSGEVVTVKYVLWARPCCLRMNRPYEITEVFK